MPVLPGTIISSLPTVTSLTGAELVPIVQGGTTKRTTTGAVANISGLAPYLNIRTVTSGATINVNPSDFVIVLDYAVPVSVTINLGPLADKIGPVLIVDATPMGNSFPITIVPDGTETIIGQASITFANDYQSAWFYPFTSDTWSM